MRVLFFALLCIVLAQNDPYGWPNYQKLSRGTKLNQLWTALTSNTTSLPYYTTTETAELFIESMEPTVGNSADDMPYQFDHLEIRKKLIHTVGATAKIQIVITNTQPGYTGIFASGCDNAIIRMSLAAKPANLSAPGIAIKCLVDGGPSVNIISMYALDGQESFNFFEHDFTNHVPKPSADWVTAALLAVALKFETVSAWPTMIGLADAASVTQNGVNVTTPNFPYRLVFHPDSQVRAAFPSKDTGRPVTVELMDRLNPGHLYDIYAQEKPMQDNNELVKIGYLTLTSKPTTTQFGDRHYFHEHALFDDDLSLKPEWVTGANEDITRQEFPAGGIRFRYGDLPF